MNRLKLVLPTLILLVAATPAHAGEAAVAERTATVKTFNGPGPSTFDRVRVIKQGRASAKNVLVLVPGTSGSAGMMTQVGADLIRKLGPRRWQVWSIDRRENWLEDGAGFDAGLAGRATPRQVFDYYLGWLTDPSITTHFQPVADSTVPFARDWGMRVAVTDMRTVIKQARQKGRNVVLGGHSLGASIAMAYATWDFNGTPGSRDISGLLLIDGGSGGSKPPTAKQARASLADLEKASPFADIAGTGVPWTSGVFAELGAFLALKAPTEQSYLQGLSLVPAELKPPVPATNRGVYGYALDNDTSPANLQLIHMHMGSLATSGAVRDWVDGGLVPMSRGARLFSRAEIGGAAWYHPTRLSLDSRSVNAGRSNPAQRVLGVKATRGKQMKKPLYAFQTDLSEGGVIRSARALADTADLPARDVVLVNREQTTSHLDPLAASPSRNDFLTTVAPFLKRIQK
jgi:pimeloyl-ACP methyl ester carboxylesterase